MLTEPGTAREEAERLVAVVLAAATLAAQSNPQWSTGSAECCVCPLCKVIAAVREPDPEFVERMATGAGDLAAGVASFMRHLSPAGSDDPWRAATRDQWGPGEHGPGGPGEDSAGGPGAGAGARDTPSAPKPTMAKKTVKKAAPRTSDEG
jgi:hypothetical protein